MADTYPQPRPAKNSDNFFEKHGKKIEKYGNTAVNTLSAMAISAGAYGAKVINDVRKFRNQQDNLRRKEHMKRFLNKKNPKTVEMPKFLKNKPSGGGGGGIYNVAQPVADKNLMNKFGKKLK